MFGFSLPKLLFTAVVIALVIYGFRWFGRLQQRNAQNVQQRKSARKPGGAGQSSKRSASSTADVTDVETMIECKVCGSYVAASGARSCGREDCPYPG